MATTQKNREKCTREGKGHLGREKRPKKHKRVTKNLGTDIALVISKLDCGGTQRVLSTLADYWVTKEKKITVITFADRDKDFFSVSPIARRIVVGNMVESRTVLQGLIANVRRIISLRKAIRDANAKVVIGFLSRTNILVILASWGLGSRIAVSERNDPARQSIGWPWNLLRRLVYRYADVVTANSRGALQTMSAYVHKEKLAFVPNPLASLPEIANRREAFSIILTVGSLTHQKGHDVLLKAFSGLAERFPEWRLEVLGDGRLREKLKNVSGALGISDRVIWHGKVRDTSPFYRAADVFVLVSRYEGTPNALLEAMSFGLPVIVSDASPGPLEFVEHNVNGLVVPVENAEALESALERLVSEPGLRHRLGAAARRRVAEFSVANVIEIWEKAIEL